MLLPLQQGLVYGPVKSRRYGLSLGINLMPAAYKLCSLNCVYCHYGLTAACTTDMKSHQTALPKAEDVARALEEQLVGPAKFNLITFSGNGEPTLHPQFPRIVDDVIALRDKHRPSARVALLSNSTGLTSEAVRKSLARIDLPILKLDVGTEKAFTAINRPCRQVQFEEVVHRLTSLQNIYLQSVFVDGQPSNTARGDIMAWMALVRNIRPREVHIYSIDRPVPNAGIALVSPTRLEGIASVAYRQTGIAVKAFYPKRSTLGA
jgi:wyosine [tRNA(Phe)-imidazoG37] synthetase (radical SAM superfamily)